MTVNPQAILIAGEGSGESAMGGIVAGEVQHRAGMEESAKIIAINSDPDAPIFSVAQYGIVGDLNQVIPMMIKAIKERR